MLSKEDVLKIAKLSKLEFSENEIEKFRVDLNKIFDHMEELNSVDTSEVEPLFNVLDLKDVLKNVWLVEFLENRSLKIGREKIFWKIEIFRYILEKI